MRLDKYLANSGVATRSVVKKIIKSNRIKVNDKIVNDPKFDVKDEEVFFDNKKISYRKYVYIMLNKPKDYISATFDKKHKIVIDLLNNEYSTYDIFPVGRLDIDTEGLLILTNDGVLAHNLLAPKKHVLKKYYVEIESKISSSDILKLENGVDIGDHITKSDTKINLIDDKSLYISISEGKFHQVKRMFEAVSNKVTYLKRVMMNNLELDSNLKLGEFRELSEEELKLLKGEL
ncbi:pseudouridine synthase [Oceanivirga miroungae]|uniref:Pseudouridine synthase n=1 Tax=Oceanivirga miroungae TaxID=1130046 RepID=A0A6I8ME37_9FUSO|nr:pseudouridine synthase [Oceanivirga miroungae]VWL85725.1 pseudouridine synthase [Oceanivirga miroungae]